MTCLVNGLTTSHLYSGAFQGMLRDLAWAVHPTSTPSLHRQTPTKESPTVGLAWCRPLTEPRIRIDTRSYPLRLAVDYLPLIASSRRTSLNHTSSARLRSLEHRPIIGSVAQFQLCNQHSDLLDGPPTHRLQERLLGSAAIASISLSVRPQHEADLDRSDQEKAIHDLRHQFSTALQVQRDAIYSSAPIATHSSQTP